MATMAKYMRNTKHGDDLTEGKRYSVIEDILAKDNGLIRVIDDSGEDYCYDINDFYIINMYTEELKEKEAGK